MIYLASNSPRRRELLQQIHVHFEPLLFRGPGRNDLIGIVCFVG